MPNVLVKFGLEATGGMEYVDRGDPSAYDWETGDLTLDGNWHELDCSGIVPEGAKAIHFKVVVQDDADGNGFQIGKNDNSNRLNTLLAISVATNVTQAADGLVTCDNSKKVEYKATNTTWTLVQLLIRGWILENG